MRKIKIVFDFDSTLYNSVSAVTSYVINTYYEEIMAGLFPYPIDLFIKKWDMSDEIILPPQEINAIFEKEAFFKLLQPNMDRNGFDMPSVLEELATDDRFDVSICSMGSPKNLALKRKFILERLPFMKADNLILLEFDKNHTMDKSCLVADIMIDDSANAIKSAVTVTHRILYAHRGLKTEWNQELFNAKQNGLYRADSVGDLNKLLGKIIKGLR